MSRVSVIADNEFADLRSSEVVTGGAAKRSPTSDDSAVGCRIRHYRTVMRMPLIELSRRVGVSTPQMHRYEFGQTRVAASRLIAIAAALGVSVEALVGSSSRGIDHEARPNQPADVEVLLRAFSKIRRSEQRNALIALARSMASAEPKDPS